MAERTSRREAMAGRKRCGAFSDRRYQGQKPKVA
ncbi:hypothetical protein FHW20_001340 [Ochrobactrum intermedium]|jgi:hypothetical protein|uniref:Uncharacterized protein n=1 Tax=Brucella intermedia TaxID=94625 RepID=A0ABR6ALS3_9HYPH|nr:hypothetical protein [Brucella intermedia]NYD81587.1 hypothetical protein [Brucella intermedia]